MIIQLNHVNYYQEKWETFTFEKLYNPVSSLLLLCIKSELMAATKYGGKKGKRSEYSLNSLNISKHLSYVYY